MNKSVDEQVELFHDWLKYNSFFSEKVAKISTLDKQWMSPELKQLHRSMQREFCKHRKSMKYKKLKSKFKRLKRKSVKCLYSDFVFNLKQSDPAKWYQMAKKIGAVNET